MDFVFTALASILWWSAASLGFSIMLNRKPFSPSISTGASSAHTRIALARVMKVLTRDTLHCHTFHRWVPRFITFFDHSIIAYRFILALHAFPIVAVQRSWSTCALPVPERGYTKFFAPGFCLEISSLVGHARGDQTTCNLPGIWVVEMEICEVTNVHSALYTGDA